MSGVLISDGCWRTLELDTKQENSWFTGQCGREGASILYLLSTTTLQMFEYNFVRQRIKCFKTLRNEKRLVKIRHARGLNV